MTQWTFMARPGHPVFLDAIGRTLRQAESEAAAEAEARARRTKYDAPSAVSCPCTSHWRISGGADCIARMDRSRCIVRVVRWSELEAHLSSDCVYRYLLTRYGVHPDELSGRKDPFRIGDVL